MINKRVLDALGDRWMVCTDNDGISYGNFHWQPIGQWTDCPRWDKNTKADCNSGGLFGQGPGGFGWAKHGLRFKFCETGPERIPVDGNKIKVRRARILYVGKDAFEALAIKCPSFGGSLDLRGCDLKGITLPQSVGGWLDLGGSDLKGITLPLNIKIIK